MIEPRGMEQDRGRVIVIATLAVVAVFLLSQVTYPPALRFIPPPDVTPVDGTSKTPKLPLLKRLNPLRKKRPEYEHHQPAEVSAPSP